MSRIKSKDTKPEIIVRQLLHRLGFRFRLHARELPGTPDIVFRSRKKAVLVHGCYWHGHGCKRGGSGSRSNIEYWRPKIARNRARDAQFESALSGMGWKTLIVWECETTDPNLAERLIRFLNGAA